ncbi:unnamed protein product [Cochlearia groenlandica]
MMSPKQISDDRGSSNFRHAPSQIIHVTGNFLRIWSVYSMYRYLNQTGAPVVLFLFCCLVPSSIVFLILQKPWKGRALSNQQIVPSLINGVITALYFILWGKGLQSCGPLRWPYCNAGSSFLLISRMGDNQQKKRLHAITITSATCFLFPLAMWELIIGSSSEKTTELPFSAWAFLSTILFGIILIFYVDNIAEERLHMVFSSPRHLMVAGVCIIVMEIAYEMDFSLPGFIVCCLVLGFGIFEATSLERGKKDSTVKSEDLSNGNDFDTSPILPL